MTGPPSRREALSSAAVIEVARTQIAKGGVHAMSLRQVAAELGVTAPALYRHFPDKRELIRAVADHELAGLIDRFARVRVKDPIKRMRRFSQVYIDYALENPELFDAMLRFPPATALGPRIGEELDMATAAFGYAADAIAEAVAQGLVRDDLDPDTIQFTTWTVTHGLANVLLLGFPLDEPTKRRLVATVLDTMFAGLAPPG